MGCAYNCGHVCALISGTCVYVCIHMYPCVRVCKREYEHFCGSVSVHVQGSVHACLCCVTVCTHVCGRVGTCACMYVHIHQGYKATQKRQWIQALPLHTPQLP